MINISELAKTYAEGKITDALSVVIENAYIDGYVQGNRDGYSQGCQDSKASKNHRQIFDGREAFETQMYPCKDHIEILEDFFGSQSKISIDELFTQIDYISGPIIEQRYKQYHIIQKGNLFGVLLYDGEIKIVHPAKYLHVKPENNSVFYILRTDFSWFVDGLEDFDDEKDEKYWRGPSVWSNRDLEDAFDAAYEI